MKVIISDRSSLLLDGDVVIEKLELDGDLRIIAAPGSKIVIRSLELSNLGTLFEALDLNDAAVQESSRIRGYVKKELESVVIHQFEPGETVINR